MVNLLKRYLFFCLALIFVQQAAASQGLQPGYLRAEYKENPFLDQAHPRLSWELKGAARNQFQKAYQLIVSSTAEKLGKGIGDFWDSGKVQSGATNQVVYAGQAIPSGKRVWWKVRVWDADGQVGDWSPASYWELGKLSPADWQAKWIGADVRALARKNSSYDLPPSPYFRQQTLLDKKVKSARLYISSLGLHNFYINGQKIGSDYFGSGWTDYNKRVYYQVYDVTKELVVGENAFAAVLSEGWYAGYLGYALLVGSKQVKNFYGDVPLLKAQIDVLYTDGTRDTISTNKQWTTGLGAIQESDLLQGETHDARKELEGWNRAGFREPNWGFADEFPDQEKRNLQLYPGNPVQIVRELPVKTIKNVGKEKYMIDFGQNFAGIVRLHMRGNKGDSLVIRYGEMLHPDGSLVTENLRQARAIDTYVFRGDPKGETWSPSFTFHGFQYVEITGLKEAPKNDFLMGLPLSSTVPEVGHFASDHGMLNQLYSNIIWTQRANYLDIPTDCPQRDERLGWTGDAQVYMRSAAFNTDIAAFHTKWIQDLNDAQWGNGAFPIYAPMPTDATGLAAIRRSDSFSPGWSEAGIICTYEIFRIYNDRQIVKKSLPHMQQFMAFLKARAKGKSVLVEGSFDDTEPKGGFGDWLSVGDKTSPDLLATLYYFYCTKLMQEMCAAVGDEAQGEKYAQEGNAIRVAFKKHYMDASGRLITNSSAYGDGSGYVEGQHGFAGHTQTAYANAIYMGLLEESDQQKAGQYLRDLVESNGNKLTTGFLGFKPLLPALSATGSSDKAYALLLSTEYPSLGYEIANGATSIWERWDSYIKDKGFVHNAAMNSFSHYAFGSVNEWMFENMVGIKALKPGFSTIAIKPEIANKEVKSVSGSYRSIAGMIKSAWQIEAKSIKQRVEIPVNCIALCYVEAKDRTQITLDGKALSKLPYLRSVKQEGAFVVLELGSGNYTIETQKL